MASCTWCGREMTAAATCTVTALHRHGAAAAGASPPTTSPAAIPASASAMICSR